MAMSQKKSGSTQTFTTMANLIKLLPTGTVFLFEFLSPALTNSGQCHAYNKYMSGALLVACAFSCCFSCFTDSCTDPDGVIRYGIATAKGLWPSSKDVDTSSYRIRIGDIVHAFFSLCVFSVVALLDTNIVSCFYPSFESQEQVLTMVLPPVIGTLCSGVFAIFPNKRHGIGYRPYNDEDKSD